MLDLPSVDDPFDVLTSNEQDQRLGNSAMMSGYVALYRSLGNRAAYAALGVFMALGAFLVGRRALGSRRWGWVSMAVLTLNPYVFGLPVLDENLLFLGYSTLFMPLLIRRRVPWFTVGAMFGLALMMRHVALLCGLALLWAIWRAPGSRRKAVVLALLGLIAVTWVAHVHHHLSLGSVFRMENFGQVPPTPHRFVGDWSGLLQWPFHDHVVRTPWIPFPVFLMWPLSIAGHMGLVLFACMLAGAIALTLPSTGAKRDEGVFWLLWFLPTYLGLSAQEYWDHVNKMGIVLILFLPLALWAAAGLRAALRRPVRWGLPIALLVLVSWGSAGALADYEAPVDERYVRLAPDDRPEDAVVVASERERYASLTPWPDFGRMNRPVPFFRGQKWAALLRELREPLPSPEGQRHDWMWPGRFERRGEPVTIAFDLSERLFSRGDEWMRAVASRGASIQGPDALPDGVTHRDLDGDGQADLLELDLTVVDAPILVTDVTVDWARAPGNVLVNPMPGGIMFGFEPLDPDRIELPASAWIGVPLDAWERDDDDEEEEEDEEEDDRQPKMVSLSAVGTTLHLRVHPAPFSVAEATNSRAERFLMWHALIRQDGSIELEGPFEPIHN